MESSSSSDLMDNGNSTDIPPAVAVEEEDAPAMTPLMIIHCTILAVIGVLAMVTNCLSLLAMIKSRWLRQKSVVILASLSVADFLSGVLSPVMIYSWYILSPTEYFIQNVLDAFVDIPIYASVCHIALVGLDRFIAINFPLNYETLVSQRKLTIALVIIWIVPLFRFALLPLDIAAAAPQPDGSSGQDDADSSGITFFSLLEFGIYSAILLLMLHLYGRLWWIARQQQRKINAMLIAVASFSQQQPAQQSKQTSKANRTCGCILAAFVLTWMPFLVIRIANQAQGSYDPYSPSLGIAFDVCMTNSCINFFIYTWTSGRFRAAYKRILSCKDNSSTFMDDSNVAETEVN